MSPASASAPADVNFGNKAPDPDARFLAFDRARPVARGSRARERVRLGDARTREVDGPPRVSADAIAVGAGVCARHSRGAQRFEIAV
jgi:hypothetical protein